MGVPVTCSKCNGKIADYVGLTGFKTPIESKYYVRLDGTSPKYGSSTKNTCPHCGEEINELECTLECISNALAAENPSIPTALLEGRNEPASDSDT